MPSTSPDTHFQKLLDKWLGGDFTRADEREMQRLVENDAFRREVWEGFWLHPEDDHAARLNALRRRLEHARRPALQVRWRRALTAAAAIVLLAAGIYFFPFVTADRSTPIAKNAPPEMPSVGTLPEAEPSASDAAQPPARDRVANGKSIKSAPGASRSPTAAETADGLAAETSETTAAPAKEILPRPAHGQTAGESVDTYQQVVEPQKPLTTAQMKRSEGAAPARAAPPPAPDTSFASTPVGGWEVFQGYLRRSARLPAAARNQNVSGSVRVEFLLDESGQPRMFKILNSLGYGCDEEAIRLLQNYPWRRGNDPRVVVEVPFVR